MKILTKYLGVLFFQGGGCITLFILFGFDPIIFFKNNRSITFFVLIMHCASYMISYYKDTQNEKIDASMKQHIRDDENE